MKLKVKDEKEFILLAETPEEEEILEIMYCKTFFAQGCGSGVCIGLEDKKVLRFFPAIDKEWE